MYAGFIIIVILSRGRNVGPVLINSPARLGKDYDNGRVVWNWQALLFFHFQVS